jgi:branched-chain amino acid transport system permease protein
MADAPLSLVGVTRRFGGHTAVNNVTCDFPRGQITGLVGPNGAGKTTLFNLVTGILRPTAGRIFLNGVEVTGRQPFAIARLGVGRTYQQTRIFHRLTVLENVMLALPAVSDSLVRAFITSRAQRRRLEDAAMEHLRFIGLDGRARQLGGALGYAEQKLVMLACLLASGSAVLLLDEPTAGIDPAARQGIIDAVAQLRGAGKTIVLVEHNLDVVRGCCDRVVFLAQGQVLAIGTAAEIEADPRLSQLYFGRGSGPGGEVGTAHA